MWTFIKIFEIWIMEAKYKKVNEWMMLFYDWHFPHSIPRLFFTVPWFNRSGRVQRHANMWGCSQTIEDGKSTWKEILLWSIHSPEQTWQSHSEKEKKIGMACMNALYDNTWRYTHISKVISSCTGFDVTFLLLFVGYCLTLHQCNYFLLTYTSM